MKISTKSAYIILLAAIALITFSTCKQPYFPPVKEVNTNYLVVEGVINAGSDSTVIKLSRTVKLTDTIKSKPELSAVVTIEGTNNITYRLTDEGDGRYFISGLNLDQSSKYSLKIVTSDTKVYQSDFIPVKVSPAIDSVYYQIKSDGMRVYSATHDPSNNTRYYRWDYVETYIVHPQYRSYYEAFTSPKDTLESRPDADDIYNCWVTIPSSNIVVNSSAKLSQDIIASNLITQVSSTSEKLLLEYSIIVKQYALTKDAYDYWENIKKNTEQLGSIFDAQPSEIQGNIHSLSDSKEPVLGYISAGTVSQKRIFIGGSAFPGAWGNTVSLPYQSCKIDTIPLNALGPFYNGNLLPLYQVYVGMPAVLVGYAGSTPFCSDCRFRGSNKRPSYWIDKL